MVRQSLNDEFHLLRRELFPRWRSGECWEARYGYRSPETQEDGYCDKERRCIWIMPSAKRLAKVERERILVHEMCHAVAGLGHGERWQRRMRAAAEQAMKLGWSRLGELLVDETESYADVEDVSPEQIYRSIEDAVIDGAKPEQVLRWVAKQNGLTLDELRRRYRRADKVVADAVTRRTMLGLDAS